MATIAFKKYMLEFNEAECSGEISFELHDSPGFEYGNHTAVTIKGKMVPWGRVMVDTRYDTSIKTDGYGFDDWCRNWLSENFSAADVIPIAE